MSTIGRVFTGTDDFETLLEPVAVMADGSSTEPSLCPLASTGLTYPPPAITGEGKVGIRPSSSPVVAGSSSDDLLDRRMAYFAPPTVTGSSCDDGSPAEDFCLPHCRSAVAVFSPVGHPATIITGGPFSNYFHRWVKLKISGESGDGPAPQQ